MRFLLHLKKISLSLLTLLSVHLYGRISLSDCGRGYDSITGICKEKPDSDARCRTVSLPPHIHQKWQRVKNYTELIKLLEIPYDQQLLHRPIVQKLLDNPHLNPYTVTIAFFERFDICDNALEGKLNLPQSLPFERYGESYVTHVISGGMHLILYHIITKSDKAHQAMVKRVSKALRDGRQIYSLLKSIDKTHSVIVKEYFSSGLNAMTTQELEKSFRRTDYFQRIVKESAPPYRRVVRNYPDDKREERSDLKKSMQRRLNQIFRYAYQYNAYHFYRHHSEDYFPLSTKEKRELVEKAELMHRSVSKAFKNFPSLEENLSDVTLKIPGRYQAAIPEMSQLAIPPQALKLRIENFNQIPYPPKKYLLRLTTELDIQNSGKIVRINQNMTLVDQNITYHISDKQILFDTYVDYPGLRFKELEKSYASVTTTLLFDKYDKKFTIKGEGLIEVAECQYRLARKCLTIACDPIKYKKMKVTFLHEEMIKGDK